MPVIVRCFIHAILLAAFMNAVVLILGLGKVDAPILMRLIMALGHWHFLTFGYVSACTLNRQFFTMLAGVLVIVLSVVHQPSFQATELIFPLAGGILLGLGVQAALQEAAGPPKPPPQPPPARGGP